MGIWVGTNLALKHQKPNPYPTMSSYFLGFSTLLMLVASLKATASEPGDRLDLEGRPITPALMENPMPELGDGRLAIILTRYYEDGLGGAENWERISSIKFSGTLELIDGKFSLTALQKKPNLVKMTLRQNHRNMILAFDGKTAWQRPPKRGASAAVMSEDEARRFIHSARFGNYLLFPFAEGKEIIYIDTVPVEGKICHQIRVILDTGYQLDYYIDIRSFMEVKVENIDLTSDFRNSIVYSDYTRESGMPIARNIKSFENGEWVSTLVLDEAKVNSGVIPWMFEMPR
jgi:hypothetical protein